jgi:hypothetical protein
MYQGADNLHDQAGSLLRDIVSKCSSAHGFGSMSISIYDTAWLSMVRRPSNGDYSVASQSCWLFPECFDYIIRHQHSDGSWEAYSSSIDGILNTAASLLALRKHMEANHEVPELEKRCHMAEEALKLMLRTFDLEENDQVGFELLIVKHLSLLEMSGITIEDSSTPMLPKVKAMQAAKLAKLPPHVVYSAPSTCLHSLEAFIGDLDFDRLVCWREANGSMMGSPASTAAYLMHASSWDVTAEQYLRNVVQYGSGQGTGGVPSAWPSTIFETTWVSTTKDASDLIYLNKSMTDENTTGRLGSYKFDGGWSTHCGRSSKQVTRLFR